MSGLHNSAAWFALVRKMRPLFQAQVDAGNALCIDCGWPVYPGQRWQVGHRLAAATHPHLALEPSNLGPSHSGKGNACNQRDGARVGNKIKADRKKRSGEFIEWRRK